MKKLLNWITLRELRKNTQLDARNHIQVQIDHEASVLKTVRQKTDTYRTNIFKRTLSHSVFPRYDEVNKKWFTVKRTY